MEKYGILWIRLLLALVLVVLGSNLLGFNIFYIIFSWWTVQLSAVLFSLFHEPVVHLGNVFVIEGQVIELIPACIAASAYLLLALLIVLTRKISFLKGLTLFVVGSLMILVANVTRIEILVSLLVNQGVNYFEQLHLFFWKILSSVYVAGVWIFLSWWFQIKEIPVYSDIIALTHSLKQSRH